MWIQISQALQMLHYTADGSYSIPQSLSDSLPPMKVPRHDKVDSLAMTNGAPPTSHTRMDKNKACTVPSNHIAGALPWTHNFQNIGSKPFTSVSGCVFLVSSLLQLNSIIIFKKRSYPSATVSSSIQSMAVSNYAKAMLVSTVGSRSTMNHPPGPLGPLIPTLLDLPEEENERSIVDVEVADALNSLSRTPSVSSDLNAFARIPSWYAFKLTTAS